MSTIVKPPLPNYTITTVRPSIGCIWGNSKITEEAKQIKNSHNKQIVEFTKQLNNFKQRQP